MTDNDNRNEETLARVRALGSEDGERAASYYVDVRSPIPTARYRAILAGIMTLPAPARATPRALAFRAGVAEDVIVAGDIDGGIIGSAITETYENAFRTAAAEYLRRLARYALGEAR